MSAAVEPWEARDSVKPQLQIDSAAPIEQTLTAIATGLSRAGYQVKEQTPARFRARWISWFSLAAGSYNRVWADVTAAPGRPGTTRVVVDLAITGADRVSRRRTAEGLSAAVAELRAQGHAVEVSPWRGVGHPDRLAQIPPPPPSPRRHRGPLGFRP